MSEQRTRFDLRPEHVPSAWFNIMPDLAQKVAPLPPLSPVTKEPIGPGGPGAAVPRDPDHAGGLDRPVDRHPRPRHRHLPPVEADAVVPRHAAGAGAEHARAHLLQVRRGVARRVAQAEHRGAAGVLQQGGGDPPHRHGDGRRTVGIGDGDGVQHLRPGVHGLHGEGLVRAEAVPAGLHGDVRRRRARVAVRHDELRPRDPRRSIPTPPGRSASRSARRSRTPPRTRTRTTRSAACWGTCCCTSP